MRRVICFATLAGLLAAGQGHPTGSPGGHGGHAAGYGYTAMMKCAEESGLSAAGKKQIQEIFKPSKGPTGAPATTPATGQQSLSVDEVIKNFEQKETRAKAALAKTDSTKVTAFETCVTKVKEDYRKFMKAP